MNIKFCFITCQLLAKLCMGVIYYLIQAAKNLKAALEKHLHVVSFLFDDQFLYLFPLTVLTKNWFLLNEERGFLSWTRKGV
jgi:hypothetical protein